jgi:2-polyprenyl-6-methoxyphenol hydroxylase-like FAD-dependent oxidoreductase
METVNIIGGGIGGLALANALQNEGIHFNLFEQASLITEVGAAISISKAALEKSGADFSKSFPTYQKLREKKVSFIVNTSWRFGKLAQNPVTSRLAKYIFKYMPESEVVKLEKRLNDLSYISQ